MKYLCANLGGFGGSDTLSVVHHDTGTKRYAYITAKHDCDRFNEHAQVTVAVDKKTVEALIYDLMEIHAEMV